MVLKLHDAVVWLCVWSLSVSAMVLPATYRVKGAAVWQKCKWACLNQPQSAGYCPCNVYRKHLHKRSNGDDYAQTYDVTDLETMDTDQLLDQLLGEILSLANGGKSNSYQKGAFYQPLENSLNEFTKPNKRGYVEGHNKANNFKGSAENTNEDSINMVRSKKRWLSLHDQFDSQDRGGDMVVPNLWKEDGARKAFRYGKK